MTDITKTGAQNYRQLQDANDDPFKNIRPGIASLYDINSHSKQLIASPLNGGSTPWGESIFDEKTATGEQFQNLGDIRAENQPWYAQLGAATSKGLVLLNTTFIDGTLGLLTGIAEGAQAKTNGASWLDSFSKLWDNEISNGLQRVNEVAEEMLPNYRTQEELEGPWYKNLGTMNFWADNVLKNLGFVVGAYYSGGAWNKLLKFAGILKGSMGAKVTGSVLSAVNEGRIEANQGASNFLDLQFAKIVDAAIEQGNPNAQYLKSIGLSDEEILDQLSQEDANIARITEDAKNRANAMGLTTLIGNTVLLSLNNFDTFGKLYARGYKNARTIAKGRVTKEAMSEGLDKAAREVAQEEAGKRISKEGGEYVYDEISKKMAIARGIRHGLVEGNEEMAQAFISETAGQMQSPDSPNAYYEALLDPKAEIETNSFLKSVTEGFVNTYGNGDRYEEFAVGAIIGLFGIPTFGKVQNSDAATWLGRGKTIGVSGGLFGEIGLANKENAEGKEAVKFMNNFTKKVQDQKEYFVRSQSFTNAMDGWAEEEDAFEYKNAEDNNSFSAISRFAKVGRLGDLKEMVNQDFENISDEELEKIAEFTSPKDGIGGWRNTDGSLMSSTEEGRIEMRKELIKKRDKILSEINKYESSVEAVRAIGNNSLDEDQIDELAWLNWKVNIFTDRFKSVKKENEEFLNSMLRSLNAFSRGRGRGIIDEESEEGKKILKAMDNAKMFVEALQSSDTPLQLAALIEANPKLIEFIEEVGYPIIEDLMGVDAATFDKSMKDLKDASKIAKATKKFNQRYKEFKDNPIKLIKNRTTISNKKEKIAQAANNANLKDKVSNSLVSSIVQGIENGDLDTTELKGMFSEEDTEFLNNEVGNVETPITGKQKVEEAQKIIQTSTRMVTAISDLDDDSIDSQAIEDAFTLLKHSKEVSESEQEMLDTATQAYNDPFLLYREEDSSMQELTQEEIEDILNDRIDAAKSIIEQAKAILEEENEELEDLPTNGKVEVVFTTTGDKVIPASQETSSVEKTSTTGHDATPTVVSENERRKEVEAKEAERKKNEDKQRHINDFFDEIRQEVAPNERGIFDSALSSILNYIEELSAAGVTPEDMLACIIKGHTSEAYKALKTLVPTIDLHLIIYINSKVNANNKDFKKEETFTIKTPVVTEEEVRSQTTQQMDEDPNEKELAGTYQYWKPTISYLSFGKAYSKGEITPFYKIARSLKKQNGIAMFTEAQLKRIEAVGKYLEEKGAFKLVDSGAIKPGDEISFVTDSTLNDNAGETVILMADSQGRIIGDVMSPNETRFQRQAYLPAFVDRVIKEYQEAGSPQFFKSKETTKVDKNMVGKVPYLSDNEEMNTLNAIHSDTNNPTPFLLGIAADSGNYVRVLASSGRTKQQGQSSLERTINPPITAKAGQPFLLMPTSSSKNHYMTVPIMMNPYNQDTQRTALGKAIHEVLERIPTADNSSVMSIIRDLEELISVKEIHINYFRDDVKVTIKPNKAEHQMTIYNGSKNDSNIVSQLELGLQGQPFQVSRKYINDEYKGQDYNRMIGEIAKTNLPIGATHTVSDWFTLKPIDATGNVTKAKSPRSIGKNPHAAELPVITLTRKGMQLQVNPKTWEVSDGKKTYEGQNADKVRALAFGIYTNQNMEQPYGTEWGYYDPRTDKFVEKSKDKDIKMVQEETPAQLWEKAKKAGLLNNKIRETLWEALSPEQQSTIVNKKGPKQHQWMDALEVAWTPTGFDESKLKGSVDDFLGRKGMYRRTDGSKKVWDKERETRWLSKVLPNLATEDHLSIVEGFIRISDSENPDYAYGKFQEGMMTISNIAARGTLYHEAFHAVTHTLLNDKEYQKLFDAASKRWPDIIDPIKLEEELAEDFRRFIQSEEDWYDNLNSKNYSIVRRAFAILFHKLKNRIKELSGKTPYINKLYYSINRGKYFRKSVKESDITRFSKESYTSEMNTIKEQAIANGTFMKAPNGKLTNLNERQWLQVRTKAFKEWFGDWENNPSEASKVVDENGEPLVVYHGSVANNIDVFDNSKARRKHSGSLLSKTSDRTHFFIDNKDAAKETYVGFTNGKVYEVFLNMRNTKVIDYEGARYDGTGYTLKEYSRLSKRWRDISPKDERLKYFANGNHINKDGHYNYRDPAKYQWEEVKVKDSTDVSVEKAILDNAGYDGVIFKNIVDAAYNQDTVVATDYVTFASPNQIKSATDNVGTFSTTDNDIRYRMAPGFKGTAQEFQEILNSNINNPILWKKYSSKMNALGKLLDYWRSEGYIVKITNKRGRITVTSVQKLYSISGNQVIQQYHRDKLLYDNLSQENKEYLQERGISIEEYKNMTQLEKEVLFKCKY